MNPLDFDPLASHAAAHDGPVNNAHSFRILAVCHNGPLEDRLRHAARSLDQPIQFVRAFGDALHTLRGHLYDIIVVAKLVNGMPARDFIRETHRLNPDLVIVIAAPCGQYEQLLEVMVEGAYDFVPDDADGRQIKLMLGRAVGHAHLRRKSGQLQRALDLQAASLRQRLQDLAMLNDMIHDMSAVPDLDEVLRRALARILDAFHASAGILLILDRATGQLVVRAAGGPGADGLVGLRQSVGEGIAGKIARLRTPVLVTDVDHDSRFQNDARHNPARHDGSASFIAVPLIHHGELLGELNVAAAARPFGQDDLRLLTILAGHVASAVNGALAAEELKHANTELRNTMSATRQSLDDAGERLTRAETLAHAVAATLPAAVAAFDHDLNITFANHAAAQLLGLNPGGSLRAHPARSQPAALAAAAAAVLEHAAPQRLHTGTKLNGCKSDHCLNVVVTPLRLPDGSVAGGTLVATAANCPILGSTDKET